MRVLASTPAFGISVSHLAEVRPGPALRKAIRSAARASSADDKRARLELKQATARVTAHAWGALCLVWLAACASSGATRVGQWRREEDADAYPLPAWVLLAVGDAEFERWVTEARAVRRERAA